MPVNLNWSLKNPVSDNDWIDHLFHHLSFATLLFNCDCDHQSLCTGIKIAVLVTNLFQMHKNNKLVDFLHNLHACNSEGDAYGVADMLG